MKIAIMQPTYLPWIGYFDLIDSVDSFILLDDVQFVRSTWQQRNRLLTTQGLQFLTVPCVREHGQRQAIRDVQIVRSAEFPDHHIKAIYGAYARTPYFSEYSPILIDAIRNGAQTGFLGELNETIIRSVAQYLGINTPIIRSSEVATEGRRSAKLVALCQDLGATSYLSPVGSASYLKEDAALFEAANIEVVLQNYECQPYRQAHHGFTSHASVIDAIFNLGTAAAQTMRDGRHPPIRLMEFSA